MQERLTLSLQIKISGIQNLEQARFASGLGVEYISLNLDADNSESMSPLQVGDIVKWISGPQIIAYLGNAQADRANAFYELLKLKTIELNEDAFDKNAEYLANIWLKAKEPIDSAKLLGQSTTSGNSSFMITYISQILDNTFKANQNALGYDVCISENDDLEKIELAIEKLRGS